MLHVLELRRISGAPVYSLSGCDGALGYGSCMVGHVVGTFR